jgi:drug/metabolite transporter superfamily protein YnfA
MMLFFKNVAAYGSIFHDKSIAWLMALKQFFGESVEKNDERGNKKG